MIVRLGSVLGKLRQTLDDRVEQAYRDRDAKGTPLSAQWFAAGESHAYGVALDDLRQARKETARSCRSRR